MPVPRSLLGVALVTAVVAGGLLLLRPWAAAPDGTASDRESVDPMATLRSDEVTKSESDERPAAVLRGAPPADRPLAPREGGLYGLVLEAGTNAPVTGVTVYALRLDWYHGKYALLASAVSDTEGRYRLRGLTRSWEDTALFAVGSGWVSEVVRENVDSGFDTLPTSLCFEVAEGDWIPFDVPVRAAVHILGAVSRPDGSPAARATVHLDFVRERRYFPWDVLPPVACDEQGRYELTALPRQMLTARLEGYVDAVAEVRASGGALDIRFLPPHRAHIRVVDGATGSPVEGAEVGFAWQHMSNRHESETLVYVATDAQGVASLEPVPYDGFSIEVRHDGYLVFGYGKVNRYGDVAEETKPGLWTGTVELVPLATIEGRVEWPPGGALPPVAHIRSTGRTRHLNGPFRGFTDVEPDGTFRLRVSPDGTHRLSFFASDTEGLWDVSEDVEAGTTGVVLQPVMTKRHEVVDRSRWGRWILTLRDTQGRPLANALIERRGPARAFVSPDHPEEDLEGGRVEVRVAPGAESVWLSILFARTVDDEELGALLVGPLGPEGGSRGVTFPAARTVTGRVLAPDGRPVQGVEVWAECVAPFGDPYWRDDETLTDADGRFTLRRLLQESYDVSLGPFGTWVLPGTQRVQAGAKGLVFQLVAPVSSTITVRDEKGEPMERARVILWQRDGVAGRDADRDGKFLWTDGDGTVTVEGLEEGGLYELKIKPPKGRRDLRVHVDKGWTPRDEIVVLSGGLTVKGVVRDAAGRPTARAEVWLEHPGGRLVKMSADGIGRFAFRRVAPGHVRLGVCFREAHEDGWAPDLDVAALAGDEGIELRLGSARDLYVRVEIPDEFPLDTRTMDLTPAEIGAPGARKRVHLSTAGAALFRGLEPGQRYRLWGGPYAAGGYVLAEIDGEQTSVLTPMAKGGDIAGRLLLPPDAEQTGVKIVKRGIHCHATPLPHGEFRLVGVPPGEWTLEAWCHVDNERRVVRQTAQAGATELSFDLTGP